jgi:hypothetical protein
MRDFASSDAEGVGRFVPSVFDRVVVGVDVQEFSARIGRRRRLIQNELDRIPTEAARAANLDRSAGEQHGRGVARRLEDDGGVDTSTPTKLGVKWSFFCSSSWYFS